MSFSTALSGGQVNSLRGVGSAVRSWAGDQRISICPNTAVLSCRVNGAVTGGATPYAQFNYNGTTVGAYTSVQVDQTILISHTNSPQAAYFRGRIRTAPTSSILYINETSDALTSGDYVFVIDHYDLTDRLARPDSTTPTIQYKDYDLTFAKMAPVVVGLRTGYQLVSSGGVARVAFDVSSSYSAEYGATISSYQFTFTAASYTVISGSLASAIVTVDFNANHWQWGKLVVTDSNGVTWTRIFAIAVDIFTDGFEGAKIVGDLATGYNATVKGFTGLSTVIDGTFCMIGRTVEIYNAGSSGLVVGNSIDFLGWLYSEQNTGQGDNVYSFTKDVTFELHGVAAMMQALETQALAIRLATSPSVWDEIKQLTPRRAIIHLLQRHSTVLNLCDFAADDTTDTFLFPYFGTQGDYLLPVCNVIGEQINSALEFAADGRIQLTRSAWHLSAAARAALTDIADFTNLDLLAVQETIEYWDKTGKIDADGAVYNSASGQITAFRSRAPGFAQGHAGSAGSLNNQVLAATTDQNAAQTELNQRSGNEFVVQNQVIAQTFNLPDGYYWLTPSMGQIYTWTLNGSENVRGLVYTTADRWVCAHVEHEHNNELGSRSGQATFWLIGPVGDPGATVPPVTDGSVDMNLPELPPFDPFPNLPEYNDPQDGLTVAEMTPDSSAGFTGVMPVDGNGDLIWTLTQAFLTKSFMLASPVFQEITPSDLGSFQIEEVIFDPFYQYNKPNRIGAYLLAQDGTNSAVWYTSNVAASPPTWTKGANIAGVYTKIEPTNAQGAILVYSPSQTSGYDWTIIYNHYATDEAAAGHGNWNSQGDQGPFPSWVFGSGYGGPGNYNVRWSTTLTVIAPSELLDVVMVAQMSSDGSGNLLLQWDGFANQNNTPPTSQALVTNHFTKTVGNGQNLVTSPGASFFRSYNGNNYPGNPYNIFTYQIILKGKGDTPVPS